MLHLRGGSGAPEAPKEHQRLASSAQPASRLLKRDLRAHPSALLAPTGTTSGLSDQNGAQNHLFGHQSSDGLDLSAEMDLFLDSNLTEVDKINLFYYLNEYETNECDLGQLMDKLVDNILPKCDSQEIKYKLLFYIDQLYVNRPDYDSDYDYATASANNRHQNHVRNHTNYHDPDAHHEAAGSGLGRRPALLIDQNAGASGASVTQGRQAFMSAELAKQLAELRLFDSLISQFETEADIDAIDGIDIEPKSTITTADIDTGVVVNYGIDSNADAGSICGSISAHEPRELRPEAQMGAPVMSNGLGMQSMAQIHNQPQSVSVSESVSQSQLRIQLQQSLDSQLHFQPQPQQQQLQLQLQPQSVSIPLTVNYPIVNPELKFEFDDLGSNSNFTSNLNPNLSEQLDNSKPNQEPRLRNSVSRAQDYLQLQPSRQDSLDLDLDLELDSDSKAAAKSSFRRDQDHEQMHLAASAAASARVAASMDRSHGQDGLFAPANANNGWLDQQSAGNSIIQRQLPLFGPSMAVDNNSARLCSPASTSDPNYRYHHQLPAQYIEPAQLFADQQPSYQEPDNFRLWKSANGAMYLRAPQQTPPPLLVPPLRPAVVMMPPVAAQSGHHNYHNHHRMSDSLFGSPSRAPDATSHELWARHHAGPATTSTPNPLVEPQPTSGRSRSRRPREVPAAVSVDRLPKSVAEQMRQQANTFVQSYDYDHVYDHEHDNGTGIGNDNNQDPELLRNPDEPLEEREASRGGSSLGRRKRRGRREGPKLQVRRTLRVKIKKNRPILGIAIEGGVNVSGQLLPRIVCVHEDGAAYQCGKLRASDVILEVNGLSTVNMTHKEIADTIANAYYEDECQYIEFLIGESVHV